MCGERGGGRDAKLFFPALVKESYHFSYCGSYCAQNCLQASQQMEEKVLESTPDRVQRLGRQDPDGVVEDGAAV